MKDAIELFGSSKILKTKVQNHILKLILGANPESQPEYKSKLEEYNEGLLDEYSCYVYIPPEQKQTSPFTLMKVKDIKKFLYEVYTDQLFSMIDLDLFAKNEVENKGIIVIDELDKLVKSVRSISLKNFRATP